MGRASRGAAKQTYQVADELVHIRGQSIGRQGHTEGEAALGLGSAIGNAPGVEDDASLRVGVGSRV